MNEKHIALEQQPDIKNLQFRFFQGDEDFPRMFNIIEAAYKTDNDEDGTTLKDLVYNYQHLTNCDPSKDMLFAEVNGETVAYARIEWQEEDVTKDRVYKIILNITPKWRGKGIEPAMISWCERRLKIIANEHTLNGQRYFEIGSNENKKQANALLESMGYSIVRYFIEMSRSLTDIPSAELPKGIDVRAVKHGDVRTIWDANVEAFRDHWGTYALSEEDYKSWVGSKYFQPELWQVAWEGEEVVASVMNYIDHDYNHQTGRHVGWTEEISTRKKWRRLGIAKALIVRSMHMHKEKGMTEVALSVDTNNPSDALRLYESLNYKKDKTFYNYRKPF